MKNEIRKPGSYREKECHLMNSRHLNNDQIGNVTSYQTFDAIGEAWTQVLRDNLDLPQGARILDASSSARNPVPQPASRIRAP